MATYAWNTGIQSTSDATFRAWVSELLGYMIGVGMSYTADTGQINTATVARPAANASAGYAIFNLFSGLLYMKLEFGCGGSQTYPQMWITVGTGTDGAGTITGTMSTRTVVGMASAPTLGTNYRSRICYNETYGVFWVMNKRNGSTGTFLFCGVATSVDSSGVPTAKGFQVYTRRSSGANQNYTQSVNVLGSVTYAASLYFSMIYGDRSTTADGSNFHPFKHYAVFPNGEPLSQFLTVINADIAEDVTFQCTPVGTTPLTYLTTGDTGWAQASSLANNSLAALYM